MSATLTIDKEKKSTEGVPEKIVASTSQGYKMEHRGAQNMSMGNPTPWPIPEFDDPYLKREWMLEHMAGQFRVFGRKHFGEGSAGHISIRDPVDPHTFWINPLGINFSLLKPSDMIHVDYSGNIIGGNTKGTVNAAGFAIHSALHRARPNVNAACHTHSLYGKAYSCFGKKLDMISQDTCMFYKDQAVYPDFGGVAVDKNEGQKIAEAAGDAHVIILQNHGLLTVGETVDEAAFLYSLAESSCRAQLLVDAADKPSKPKELIKEEAATYTNFETGDPESLFMESQVDFMFEKAADDSFMEFTKAREGCEKAEKAKKELLAHFG